MIGWSPEARTPALVNKQFACMQQEEQRVEQEQKVQTEQRGAKRSRARHGRAVNHLSSPPASDSVTHVTAL